MRVALEIGGLVLLFGVGLFLFAEHLDHPEVYLNTATQQMVGCRQAPNMETLPAESPTCQRIAKGKYTPVWVSPQWRP